MKNKFIRSIVENPMDVSRRLVFADWLDENGEELRAEFIRVQCELASLGKEPPTVELQDLRSRTVYPLTTANESFPSTSYESKTYYRGDCLSKVQILPGTSVRATFKGISAGEYYEHFEMAMVVTSCVLGDGRDRSYKPWYNLRLETREGLTLYNFDSNKKRREILKKRETELSQASLTIWKEWHYPLAEDPPPYWTWNARGGFVEELSCNEFDWTNHKEIIVLNQPILKLYTLVGQNYSLDRYRLERTRSLVGLPPLPDV